MMSVPGVRPASVFIAGVGTSPSVPNELSSTREAGGFQQPSVSASIKALLDAGLTYDKITHGIGCVSEDGLSARPATFYGLGDTGIPICEVDSKSALYVAAGLVRGNGAQCVLVSELSKHGASSIVVVSDRFLRHHPWLKDSAALLTEVNSVSRMTMASGSAEVASSKSGLTGLCELVWTLRGWSQHQRNDRQGHHRYHMAGSDGRASTIILCRADGKPIPDWKEIEHKNDGRQRLGYNPLIESRDTVLEDWASVKSNRDHDQGGYARGERSGEGEGNKSALARL